MNSETVSQAEQLKRRSQRLMLRIRVEVIGTGPDGAPFKEKTHTVTVNRHGAAIALHAPVRLQSVLTVTNTTNLRSSSFTVVNRIEKSTTEVPEWGVESAGLDPNFWGVLFPDDSPKGVQGGNVDVVLECQRCRSRFTAQMAPEQFKSLSPQQGLRRHCAKCAGTTDWTVNPSRVESHGAAASRPSALPPPTSTGADQRHSNRINIKLPVRIRMEDVGETENISKTGVCFTTTLEMIIGDRVRLTVGYSPESNAKEVAARIVWKRRAPGEQRAFYGADLEE